MAKLRIDDLEVEAPDGAPLVEVIKSSGIFISNLCYIDGLPPYAGCRTCVVEIEGMRGLQLACTTRATDGMVVRIHASAAEDARKFALSLINANHPDRCLTCHRTLHCRPGDTCLRDSVVTHRCLTCAKNYRCELQTTNELVEMAGYEPWLGEERTYYMTPPPPADRNNPYFEFDPQMCILCTRCVRACAELRHTNAITLSGRGWDARIAFGAGGFIHESDCDFCGACLDVCPTATLMEHPNKWTGGHPDHWTGTACTYCSVACTIRMGVKKGRGLIVKPEPSNPVSNDQICVRGRFHYDYLNKIDRLAQPLIRHNGAQTAATWDEALEFAAQRLAEIRQQYGPEAIAFLGSPWNTNEENYLLQKVARAVVSTNNVDSSLGPVSQGAAQALRRAFGTEILTSDLAHLAQSQTILAIADDLESSHSVAALRIKNAVVRKGARLIVVSPRWGELCDFAEIWVRPRPGQEATALNAIAGLLLADGELAARAEAPAGVSPTIEPPLSADVQQAVNDAATILAKAAHESDHEGVAFVYALPHIGEVAAEAVSRNLANIAIIVAGPDKAGQSLHMLPAEANGVGLRDMGVTPGLLPGYRFVTDAAKRRALEDAWGTPLSDSPGLSFYEALEAVQRGRLKALVVLGDNPMLLAPDKERVRKALSSVDLLVVIDGRHTDTAKLAHLVLPDVGTFAKDGTVTSADRRILKLRAAMAPIEGARPAWWTLSELGRRLTRHLGLGGVAWAYEDLADVMEEIARLVPLYSEARYEMLESGSQQILPTNGAKARLVLESATSAPDQSDGFILTTSRTLYTSLEAAAVDHPEPDRLHREESVHIHPDDAARLSISEGQEVTLVNQSASLAIKARISDEVLPGALFVPLYYRGGAVTALFHRPESVWGIARVQLPTQAKG